MSGRIDTERLMSEARKSCCKESFMVLERTSILRIGAGARVGDGDDCLLFIEVGLRLCSGKSISSTVSLEKGVKLAKLLRDMGYDITCDDGEVYFEKRVSGDRLNWELDGVLGAIAEVDLVEEVPA